MPDLRQRLTEAAIAAGAQKTGFAKATDVDETSYRRFRQWLDEGNHGDMHYLAKHAPLRRNPKLLSDDTAGAQTVMVCAFSYFHPEHQEGDALFATYAHGSDYHEVLRRRLQPLAGMLHEEGYEARICIDTAPILERYWAVQCGVGFIGRNHQLIIQGMGSYFFLAEIITSATIEPDEPCTLTCEGCGRCLRGCPGGALRPDGGFDARLCLSYLTIEHRGELPPHIGSGNDRRDTAHALGNRVYGCDECQRVCPHNVNPPLTEIDEFHMRPSLRHITRAEILAMTPEEFAGIFRHSAVKRAKLTGLKRNAKASETDTGC